MEEWNFSRNEVDFKMSRSLFQGESEIYNQIETDVIHTYKLITSSRYSTNRHLEQITKEAKVKVSHIEEHKPLVYLTYIRGVFSLSVYANNYEEFERRFTYFYDAMIEDIVKQLNEQPENNEQFSSLLDQVLFLITYDAGNEYAPWPHLLDKLIPSRSTQVLSNVYHFLNESIDPTSCSRALALTYCYISLLVDKEVTALSVLTQHGLPYGERELYSHFTLLKKKQRWRTMKQWLTVLFPSKQKRNYGSLQPIVDEMNTALPTSTKEKELIWNRWIESPSYTRFQTYTKHLSSKEQKELIEQLLPKLEKRLTHLETIKTYERLLLLSENYERMMNYFLKYEREALRLTPEKEALLEALEKHAPKLAKPVYHQFIIRLVEKKSRAHYEQAVHFIKKLNKLYKTDEDRKRFIVYIKGIKKMYRTYRAFIEELKQIDL